MTSFLFSFCLSLVLVFETAEAKSLEVCGVCKYQKIQDAIDKSNPKDTILIRKGIYQESTVVVRHPLTLLADDGAELHHQEADGDAIYITAIDTTVQGLKIVGSGKSSFHDFSAIKVANTSGCILRNNEILNSQYGIMIAASRECQIENNRITTSSAPVDLLGDGIHLWKSEKSKIVGNTVHGHRDGIYLEFVNQSFVENNQILGNNRYGLHFMFSSDNEFRENTFSKNDAGVAVMYSKRIKMYKNIFAENLGAASFGLLLKDISDSTVSENIFRNNSVGIFLEGSNRNFFRGNIFEKNGWALRLLSSCEENVLTENIFLSNTLELATNSKMNLNTINKNYWDRHVAIDLDKDGFADLPYQPSTFSSFLVEKYKLSILIIDTPFLRLLDWAERQFPALSPTSLQDLQPLLKKSRGNYD